MPGATMERISYNIHKEVNSVKKECTLEEFGRQYNPVFKAELGYGYFEFTEPEYLKPKKNVIVMDKVCLLNNIMIALLQYILTTRVI